jgi:hypothetical protein
MQKEMKRPPLPCTFKELTANIRSFVSQAGDRCCVGERREGGALAMGEAR